MPRGAGSPSRVTTRGWAHGRWRGSSRSTSSARWPKSCCSDGWWAAATCASPLPRMSRNCAWTYSRHSRWCRLKRGGSTAAVDDAALGQVVGGHFHGDRIAGEDADVVLAHFARNVCSHDVTILELHAEGCIGQSLDDLTLHLNRIFFRHWGADIAQTPSPLQCARAADPETVPGKSAGCPGFADAVRATGSL